jgi:antitoxin component of MazEF toxin-antitoxin module
MKQLHEVAEKYRQMKRYHAKLSKWGTSVGLRIPKELTEKYKFKKEVMIVPEDNGILVLPA